ncbi:hypothetical protein E1176_06390 [Fulvivirga sp. RKSG066]|uniref:hypothetical protein n=1 Tax=Fulvivirga aurantia TaxID=2529383 RepID=UPI0012BC5F86|nr:hypothetical protein [Fulvivirga aurantia]MTI20643.1 hypothetical protein [Fulvivirga aurantia]
MKAPVLFVLLFLGIFSNEKVRIIEYNGNEVKTTYAVDAQFYGKYAGAKTGYLILNEDGTGVYNYDVFGFAPATCKKDVINIEWGFLLDENDQVVSFEREYGLSYPILMKSLGNTQFQGCRTPVMLDFIMVYKNGDIGVSSSDDWIKE